LAVVTVGIEEKNTNQIAIIHHARWWKIACASQKSLLL